LNSYVLALHATPELKARGDGLAKLCLTIVSPFGVDIGFIDPDRSNGAALAISEWDRSYSKDAEKLATGKMAGSQSRIMTQGMMVAEIKRLHRQGLSSLCSHTAIEINKLDNNGRYATWLRRASK